MPASQAGRHRFEPGRPLHYFFFINQERISFCGSPRWRQARPRWAHLWAYSTSGDFGRLPRAVLFLVAFALAPAFAQKRSPDTTPIDSGHKPNVVFILADNVGYGDLGSYGGSELRGAPTPASRPDGP